MPLFTSASGVQVNGGSFIDVAGDMNVYMAQLTIEEEGSLPLSALDFTSSEGPGRQVPGDDESGRRGAAERMPPHDVSHQPQILGRSDSSSRRYDEPSFAPPPTRAANEYAPRDTPDGSRLDPNNRAIRFPSLESERELAGIGPGSHPSPANFEREIAEFKQSIFPWDVPPHEPKTSIHGGTFIGGNVNHIQRQGESGLHILHHSIAGDAFHDAAERYPQPECHPETRTKLLEELCNWSHGNCSLDDIDSENDDSENEKDEEHLKNKKGFKLLWLYGPAGAGKSAIAQSLCQKLQREGSLGGAFFFQRGHSSRGNGKRLFPTIAYQLSFCLPELKRAICDAVEDDPSIMSRSLSTQLQRLIIEPCRRTLHGRTFTVIIDGLDECEGQDIQREILCSIGRSNEPQLPLQFLVASRPEPHIRDVFTDVLNGIHRPVNIKQSFEDVEKYLLAEFARIHREHRATMSRVPIPWPSADIIDDLVKKSSGYFAYAFTVIKFIDDKNFRPTKRLELVVGIKEPDLGSPFAALDQLYIQILCEVHDRPRLLKILAAILFLHRLSVDHLEQLLKFEEGDIRLALRGLHSVIDFSKEDDVDSHIVVHHASFLDFLQDSHRAGEFYVGGGSAVTDFFCRILEAFSYKHEDHFLNRRGHVSWQLDKPALQCITFSEPSSDLVSLFRSFNPDFLFHQVYNHSGITVMVLDWLKKSQPLPDDIIRVWEDYHFMSYCESEWDKPKIQVTGKDWSRYHQVLSQASPSLLKILRAIPLVVHYGMTSHLFKTRLLLDFSWDEMRTAFSSLRSLKDQDGGEDFIRKVSNVALDRGLLPWSFDSMMWDFACGALHALQQIVRGEVDPCILVSLAGWSRYLRSCPPSPKLLQDLCEIEPILKGTYRKVLADVQCHNVVHWLKTFPEPQQELIGRVECYLETERALSPDKGDPEDDWREWHEYLFGTSA
ncbi:hypothetical protein B0H19DRAFT_1378054 [Mycena capillaripes]|nr:hypothetical protein B0H19DRAFT_1378054 [Mycena capillaripes]